MEHAQRTAIMVMPRHESSRSMSNDLHHPCAWLRNVYVYNGYGMVGLWTIELAPLKRGAGNGEHERKAESGKRGTGNMSGERRAESGERGT